MTNLNPSEQHKSPLIAAMYERWTLDYIIEIVQLIAVDFVCHPGYYRNASPESSQTLQNFRFLTGNSPKFPNRMQRKMTFEALIGVSDGMGITPESKSNTTMVVGIAPENKGNMPMVAEGNQFKIASIKLRERARAYSEKQAIQGEGQLLQAFITAGQELQSYLRPIDDGNSVVIIGDSQTKAIFDDAVIVLRDKTVASRFGPPPATPDRWPLGGILDGNGSLLIQEVGQKLTSGMMTPVNLIPVSQNNFDVMQSIANYGSRTITGVLGANFSNIHTESIESRKELFETLITDAYAWKTALDDLTKVM
jgi:hypothetical protein